MVSRVAAVARATGAAMLLLGIGASAAEAHSSPPGCGTNGLQLDLTKDRTLVRNGDVSNYTVTASNNAASACDLTGVTISLTLPAPDGTPTGQTVTLASNADYPAGTAPTLLGTVPYTVQLNPGVTDAVAEARATGVLHDAPTDHAAQISKTLGTTVTQPSLSLTTAPTPATGRPPFETTFTYTLVNNSSTNVPIANARVTDDKCAPATYTGGDANGNSLLDVGETWTYTCTRLLGTPGVLTTGAEASGTSTIDNRPVSAPPATATVRAVLPPRSAVLRTKLPSIDSRAARRNARCVSIPARLSLRAGERTTIRVRVRERGLNVQRALVRISGPGFQKRATTNANGIAAFRVRPRRSGVVVVQSDRCLGADRVTVRRARQVTGRGVPRVTG